MAEALRRALTCPRRRPACPARASSMVMAWLMVGAVVFAGLDHLVEKRYGEKAGAMGIVLGSIIDGVPECVIFGIQIATGQAIKGKGRGGSTARATGNAGAARPDFELNAPVANAELPLTAATPKSPQSPKARAAPAKAIETERAKGMWG